MNYRIIQFDDGWYAEKNLAPGEWRVLGVYDKKEKAQLRIAEEKNGK